MVRCVSPANKTLLKNEAVIDVSKVERTRIRVLFDALPVEESGRHYFNVEIKLNEEWNQVASIPLSIDFEPKNQAEEETNLQKE